MTEGEITSGRPQLATIGSGTLVILGLRQISQNVMPIIDITTFDLFEELTERVMDSFFHYFISISIVLEHRQFFLDWQKETIVLAVSIDPSTQLSRFHSLCVSVPEDQLVRSLLILKQNTHGRGQYFPSSLKTLKTRILSDREIEVLSLIIQGYINEEMADQLNIGMTAVITHRRNIMDKLGIKSVSALAIYTMTYRYVNIDKI